MIFIAFAVLSLGFVNAQDFYVGVSSGIEAFSEGIDDVAFPLTLHVGVENLGIDNLGARADGSFLLNTSSNDVNFTVIQLGLNGIYNFSELIPGQPIDFYAGVGPRLIISSAENVDTETDIGIGAIAGVSYHILSEVSIFGEARGNVYFGDPDTYSGFGFGVGAKYHF